MKSNHVLASCCLTAVLLLVSGCDFNPGADRTGCDGHPEVGRTLRDTTLAIGDTLRIDLLAEPPAFYHTEDKTLVFSSGSLNEEVAYAYGSGLGGSIVVIEPRMPGTATIAVNAVDGCDKVELQQFTVEVTGGH